VDWLRIASTAATTIDDWLAPVCFAATANRLMSDGGKANPRTWQTSDPYRRGLPLPRLSDTAIFFGMVSSVGYPITLSADLQQKNIFRKIDGWGLQRPNIMIG
jgi:hypothetical protein